MKKKIEPQPLPRGNRARHPKPPRDPRIKPDKPDERIKPDPGTGAINISPKPDE